MKTGRNKTKKILQKGHFGNVICAVLPSIILFDKKEEKKANLSFNIIFHLLFLVKQNNATCFASTTSFNTGKTIVHNMNLNMNELLHLGKQLFPYQ